MLGYINMATPSTIPTPSGVTSPELKLKPVKYIHGTKTFTRIMQDTGSASQLIPLASTQETRFEIPVKAIYLSDSSFLGTLPRSRAVLITTTGTWLHTISSLKFISRPEVELPCAICTILIDIGGLVDHGMYRSNDLLPMTA